MKTNAKLQELGAAREEMEAIIRETETAYKKIMEGSRALLDMVKKRAPAPGVTRA